MESVEIEALARADMNLLVAFEAMMQERSVTRAARRLALSQSAMSHTLRRLRDLFDDELFVRVGQEMIPTPRADRMAGAVRAALSGIGELLRTTEGFRPAKSTATFRIAAFDFAHVTLLPALAARLADRAPGMCVIAGAYEEDLARALGEGSVDLVIGLEREPQEVFQRVLSTESFTCAVRRGHPCLERGLTLQQFADLRHALVSPVGRATGFVDRALFEQGLERRVAFTSPQLFAAASAVAASDMILTGAERQLRRLAEPLGLELVGPPLDLPTFNVAMTWHQRRNTDAAHGFVRDELVELAAM